MAAGQRDIPVLLQPGNGATVRAPGEFLYLKFADREIQAIVTGRDGTQSRVKMVTGDFTAPGGGIDEVELINPDTSTPCAVVITVGDGEFDRKIIQGEVTITPGIRGADGQFVDDTRSTVRLRVAIGKIQPITVGAADQIREVDSSVAAFPANARAIPLGRDRILVSHTSQPWRLYEQGSYYETPAMNNGTGDAVGALVGNEVWVVQRESAPSNYLAIRRFDAATLDFRGQFATEITSGYQYARAMTVANGRIYIKTVDNAGPDRVFMTDLDGQLLASKEVNITAHSIVVGGGKVHLVGIGGFDSTVVVLNAQTLAPLPASDSEYPDLNLDSSDLGTIYSVAVNMDGDLVVITRPGRLAVYSPEGVTISASGSVTSCAGGGFLKSSPIDTQAEIYTQRLDDGRVLMSGEILRAALEIYTGRYMPANYLDYVYRVRAENLNGISPRTVDSGGKSFLAAGIPDDASGTFPQTLEITLREGLL